MKTWSEINSEDSKKSRDCWAPWEFRTKNPSLPSRTQQKNDSSDIHRVWVPSELRGWTWKLWSSGRSHLPSFPWGTSHYCLCSCFCCFSPRRRVLLCLLTREGIPNPWHPGWSNGSVVSLDLRRNPQSLAPRVEAMSFWLQLDLKCWGLATTWINKVLGCLREILEGTTLRSLQWANSSIQEN